MSDERYAFAQSVARLAGALANRYFRDRERLTVELKGPQDFVSHADRDVEALLRREINAAFPQDAFLGEETAHSYTGPLERCWVVDPIDGTHNFLRGIPYWNVAVAYVERGRHAEIGAVFDPVHDELFHARRGAGAWCDSAAGRARLTVAGTSTLPGAFVALGHYERASIWDAIGALVIVDEAGGRSAPFMPSPVTAKAPCLASTPGIFAALAKMSEIAPA
jgi:myo-inositol-1(or 4)-monophosphatase